MTTCPFCNATLPAEPVSHCPRCDERLAAGETTPRTKIPLTQPMWFRVGFLISCIASVVILIGGLYWVNLPRPPKPSTPAPPSPFGPATISPLGMPTIGYLSGKTNLIAAIQIRPLVEYAERSQLNPKILLTDIGIPAKILDDLDAAGLPLDRLDQIALGVELDPQNAIPTVTLAVAVRSAVENPNDLVKRIGQVKWFNLVSLNAKWVSETVLLIGTKPEAFITKPFAPGAEHLAPSLRDAIGKQVSPSAWAWLASDSQDWAESPTVKALLLATKRPAGDPLVKSLRGFAMGLSLEPEFTLGMAIQSDSETTAKAMRDFWGRKGAGQPCVIGGEERWATMDIATTPDQMGRMIGLFLTPEK